MCVVVFLFTIWPCRATYSFPSTEFPPVKNLASRQGARGYFFAVPPLLARFRAISIGYRLKSIPWIVITLSLRQSLLGQTPFGLQLPGPFSPSSGASFHLSWLSVSLGQGLLFPFTAFKYSVVEYNNRKNK